MPEGVSQEQRRAVVERARDCCEYCRSQSRFSPDPFSVEHIVPRARGGPSHLDNLAFSCQGCNNRKYKGIFSRNLSHCPARGPTKRPTRRPRSWLTWRSSDLHSFVAERGGTAGVCRLQ
ncbi:MAG: HNH endonuclease [Pirellulales bacterium]|nr:HNH endonuclease [Pirellulales bacterium]